MRVTGRLLPTITLAILLFVIALPAGAETTEATRPIVYLPMVTNSRTTPGTSSSEATERQVVALVNSARAAAGCPALQLSTALNAVAQAHSADMAAGNFMSHTGSDGSTLADRLRRAGYRFRTAAENVAAGFPDAESVVVAWLNSPGHRENMFNCSLTEAGVGYATRPDSDYRHYWTLDLASP